MSRKKKNRKNLCLQSREIVRNRFEIRGLVQGVGFRPFIYRLAERYHLSGWVANNSEGAVIELEGEKHSLLSFRKALEREIPPPMILDECQIHSVPVKGEKTFQIRESFSLSRPTAGLLPDMALCQECHQEIFNPQDRRYRYPFANCTRCGPRYTIIEALPYDRPYTSMREFFMCCHCREEYDNPEDRRFHAQPIACPECGPHVFLTDSLGRVISQKDQAIQHTVYLLRQGKIIAVIHEKA